MDTTIYKKIKKNRKNSVDDFNREKESNNILINDYENNEEVILNSVDDFNRRVKEFNNKLINDEVKIIPSRGAWGNMLVDYYVYCDSYQFDLIKYLYEISNPIENKLVEIMNEINNSRNVKLVACGQYFEYMI